MEKVRTEMIAPCGMNCALCIAHQRGKKQCPGCKGDNAQKPAHCVKCSIKNCEMPAGSSGFCFDCEKFPCQRLRQLDERYRKNYRMSMIENLEYIRRNGIDRFLENETARWTCPNCGGLLCVHRDSCLNCEERRT